MNQLPRHRRLMLEASRVEPLADVDRPVLDVAGALSLRPLLALCHLGLGKLRRRAPRRRAGQRHLAMATTMFGELGMSFWQDRAEAEVRRHDEVDPPASC
jgi:hypothetical protein